MVAMEEELVQFFKVASMAADEAFVHSADGGGEEDESRCLDALNRLKKIPVTCQLLVSTQVGKGLRRLTKHPRNRIQTLACDLIQYWKQIVTEESNTSNKRKESMATNPQAVKKTSKTEENSTPNTAPTRITQEPKKYNGPEKVTKEPSTKPDLGKFYFSRCDDPSRDKVRQLLLEALSKVYTEAYMVEEDLLFGNDPGAVAAMVESIMFENWGSMNGSHKANYRSVMFNLKDGNNPDFRRKVLLGQVKPESLLRMSTQEMASDQRQRENKQIEQKAMFDCELGGGAPKATTDQFKCGRCGQRKCTYYQMQTRSADEPMTTYVTCVQCNHHWKFC